MIYTRDIIGDQWAIFLQALAVGAALGWCFDIFRAAGLFLPKKPWAMIAKDVAFCLWAGFLSFSFLLNVNFGMPRAYIYFGEAIGFFAWYLSIGKINLWLAKRAVKIIKTLIGKIMRPVFRIFYAAAKILKSNAQKVKIFFAKIYVNEEKVLKSKRKVLYNKLSLDSKDKRHFLICGKNAGKEHGSFERSGTEKEKEPYLSDCSYCLRNVSSLFTDSNPGQNKRNESDS